MKRIFLLTICAALFLSSQFLINCSSPLDSSGGGIPSPPPPGQTDTIFVHDTVFVTDSNCDSICDTIYDTVVVTDSASDTIYVYDTVTVTDTLVDTIKIVDTFLIIDTVIVSDSCDPGPMCAEFNKYNKKVYWKLHNESGKHKLEFTATFGDECFDNILHIHIYGKKYEWNPKTNPTFTVTKDLHKNAKVMVHCKKKHHDDDKDGDDDDCDDKDEGKHENCCNVEVCLDVTKY